jgi:hypothetical protein
VNGVEQITFRRYNNSMTRAEERLLNPAPCSRIEAARLHGVDLTLLIKRLRKTPEERVRDFQGAMRVFAAIRGKGLRQSTTKQITEKGSTLD